MEILATTDKTPTSRPIWLFSRPIDLLVLGLPVWMVWGVCFFLPESTLQTELPLWTWAVFILGIDVSHVWSTLFRTYLDKEEFQHHKRLLIIAPILCFFVFFIFASISTMFFWSVLAYLALFHFVKQQYGFMRLYSAKYGKVGHKKVFKDTLVTYFSMLYPVFYWHLNSDRNFNWFVSGDFLNWQELFGMNASTGLSTLNLVGNTLFWIIIAAWLIEEIHLALKYQMSPPWGKWLWILTTAGNWYLGIVYFNSDIAFSLTNVVAHGIPYMVLILFYVERKREIKQNMKENALRITFRAVAMISIILILAFGEEYLWDMFLYRDNEAFFSAILRYPSEALEQPIWQATALAMLSLPQTTHYVLDGFIWKGNAKNPYVKQVFIS